MYAVIQTGGKQYRVAVGDRLKVETLDAQPGDDIEIDQVLMISQDGNIQVGTPILEGTHVSAQVVENGRGKKIKVFKMHRRQGYRRTQGHRQNYTELEIVGIGEANAKPDNAKITKKIQAKSEPVVKSDTDSDDLTRISGIGPVIADKLVNVGITKLAQIAQLDEASIAKIEEQLSMKGRVERENWIEQAKELVA